MVIAMEKRSFCRKFQPNQFNKTRCQHCFKSKEIHSVDALQNNKMTRKKTKFGYLYIAPENFDVTNVSQKSRRWQRRWFVLYDDGELAYSLDQHPETIPQGVIDMTRCKELKFADDITQNPYSLILTTDIVDKIFYFKADTGDEIRWWYEVLSMYPKQYLIRNVNGAGALKTSQTRPSTSYEEENLSPPTIKTMIEIKSPSLRHQQQNGGQRRTSDPWSQAKVDVNRNDSFHGTPRSVKNRKNSRQKDDGRSKTCSDIVNNSTMNDSCHDVTVRNFDSTNHDKFKSNSSDFAVKIVTTRNGHTDDETSSADVEPDTKAASSSSSELILSLPQSTPTQTSSEVAKIDDDSSMHTLRKGWLMLRGRADTEWTKHWVVLTGFSLKLFKDAWAEDLGSSVVHIDLSQCDVVLPITVSRNYGIELRCKHSRYVLSAMTPGIRDSWINAIKQNVAGSAAAASPRSDMSGHNGSIDGVSILQKRKRIAYVAPESHNRFTTTDESGTEDDDDVSLRSSSRADEGSVSESLFDSGRELASDEDVVGSGASTPRRRRSLSPTVRRSPVSRVKERNTTRRQRSPASQQADEMISSVSPLVVSANGSSSAFSPVLSFHTPVNSASRTSNRNSNMTTAREERENRLIIKLENQLESVRNELQRTRDRLNVTTEENEWLKTSGSVERSLASSAIGQNPEDLDRLRRTLQEAERDILRKQDEIETLQRKLDFSVNELSGTENVLTESLQDLEKEREKFDRLSTDWNRRVVEMESQLRDTIKRLDRRERDMRDKSEQLKEMQMLQRRHEEMQKNVETLSRRLKDAADKSTPRGVDRDALVEQLEEKLTESEKKISTLSDKVRRLEVNLDTDNVAAVKSTSSSTSLSAVVDDATVIEVKQIESTYADQIREKEFIIDSMKQYCQEQSRRLMATLRNEAEFLQRLLTDKLSRADATKSMSDVDASELRDLADDLTAVQQYLNEFDQLERNENVVVEQNSKEFHFKDVLNRLVEMQEKLVGMSRSETNHLTVSRRSNVDDRSKSNDDVRRDEYEANIKTLHERIELLSNELHEARSFNGNPNDGVVGAAGASTSSGYCSGDDVVVVNHNNINSLPNDHRRCRDGDTPPQRSFFVPLPSSSEFLWNYPISLLHDDLSKSLSMFLNEKFDELSSKSRRLMSSDDFTSILIEAMSAEICLITEISNLIEASSSEEHLSCTVVLRDLRNTYVVMKMFENVLTSFDDTTSAQRRASSLALDEMSSNFFHVYCKKINDFLKCQWQLYCDSMPPDVLKRLQFDDDESSACTRRAAMSYVGEHLISNSFCDETTSQFGRQSFPLGCFRSALLQEEINHILARMQISFECNNPGQIWDKNQSLTVITKSFNEIESLKIKLNDIFRRLMSDVQRLYVDQSSSIDDIIDGVQKSIDEHLNRLKANGTTARTPLTASGTKFVHLEKALSNELDTARLLTIPLDRRGVEEIGKILCIRGTVNGLCAWLDGLMKSFYVKFPRSPMTDVSPSLSPSDNEQLLDVDFCDRLVSLSSPVAPCNTSSPIVGRFADAVRSGLKVLQIADHYEPLTKQLLYQVCTNAVVKLSSASLFCHYESKIDNLSSNVKSLAACDQCSILRQHVDGLLKEKEKFKRRSLCDPLQIDTATLHNQNVRELQKEIAAIEMKYESERRRIKEELELWKGRAEIGCNSTNLQNEVAELEQELVEVQAAHNEEIESLRVAYQNELEDLRLQLQNEQERRKKLSGDLQNMKRLNDQSLETIERNHVQLLDEVRNERRSELQRLINEYEQQLQEEKEATRHALDALQKAHEHELSRQIQKVRDEHSNHNSSTSTYSFNDDWSRKKSHDFQDMLERMNRELCELSGAYSAKCLENSLMEDELDEAKQILERLTKNSSSSDVSEQLSAILHEMKRAKNLQIQLCTVETELDACKQKIGQLESNCAKTQRSLDDLNNKPSTSIPNVAAIVERPIEVEENFEREDHSPVASEYTPKGSRARRINNSASRRNDSRYYSSPNLNGSDDLSSPMRRHSLTPDSVLAELRQAMGLPVAERRKFFETSM